MLFEAHLHDGTIIRQTPEDQSATTPGKNSFYDVLQRIEEVAFFGVFSDEHTYVVDLSDGHFEIDGVSFNAQDPSVTFPPETKFRLIYFRRNKLHFDGLEQVGSEIEFHIGFQTTIDGKNVQQAISVKYSPTCVSEA